MAKSFGSLIKKTPTSPAYPTSAAPEPAKRPQGRPSSSETPMGTTGINFKIDDDLVEPLAAEVHARSGPGQKSSQRVVINHALRLLLAPRLEK